MDRIKQPIESPTSAPTTALGNWYATALFWKPQLALFVNERTLLPVFMPLAPVASIAQRFPPQLAAVLMAHGIEATFIEREIAAMAEVKFARTASRSMTGMMNEFAFYAEGYQEDGGSPDMIALSLRFANMIFKPIKYNSPVRLLREVAGNQVA